MLLEEKVEKLEEHEVRMPKIRVEEDRSW